MYETLGHYTVGNNIYLRKLDALEKASATGENVTWYYHDKEFDAANWLVEPDVSIKELYRRRAQQIRDKFDYVIVMASGGADSTNAILSFLENGIHLDEVIAAAPLSGLKNFEWNDKDIRPSNIISETKYAQLPLMDEIRTKWPQVKVTLLDTFEEMLKYKTDEWIQDASIWLNATNSRHSLNSLSHIKKLADAGKKIAKVYGIDKPILCRAKGGGIYVTIPDNQVQVAQHRSTAEVHSNIEPVMFYYAHDLTDLMVKMAHMIAKFTYMPENVTARKTMWDLRTPIMFQQSPLRFTIHHRAVSKIVYPAMDGRIFFQATKHFAGVQYQQQDWWIPKLHPNTRLTQLLESDAQNAVKKISPRFFDRTQELFLPLYKWWKIGHESQFAPPGYVDIDVDRVDEVLNIPTVR